MSEKDLEIDMQKKEENKKLLEKIRKIEEEIKLEKGNENIGVKYYENVEIQLGNNIITVSVAEVKEKHTKEENKDDKDSENSKEEKEEIKTYNIYFKDTKIAEINEEGKLIINEEGLEKVDPKNILGLKELGESEKPDISQINEIEGKTSEELEKEIDEYDLDDIENKSLTDIEEDISKEEISEDEKVDKLMEVEAKKKGLSKDELKSNMIELELDEIKVTENKTLRQLLGTECTRVFAVPRKRCKRIYN